MNATKVNAGPAESNGRLLLGIWRDSLHVTCGLTVCTPGSAPGPTLGNEYGKTLPFYLSHDLERPVPRRETATVPVSLITRPEYAGECGVAMCPGAKLPKRDFGLFRRPQQHADDRPTNWERKCPDTVGTVLVRWPFPVINVNIFSNKIYGSNFIGRYWKTVTV